MARRSAMPAIRQLVFEGGGMRGAAYSGALRALEEHNLVAGVRHVAGTSAGALMAAYVAVGASSDDIASIQRTTDFRRYLDGRGGIVGDIARIALDFGAYAGEAIGEAIRADIQRFSGVADLTFGELARRADAEPERYRRAWLVTSNLTEQKTEVLSAETHPDLPLWLGVRMSISIPLVFEAVRWRGAVYVDGGIAWNYPIALFDAGMPGASALPGGVARDTLGFVVGAREGGAAFGADPHVGVSARSRNLAHYFVALGAFVTAAAVRGHLTDEDVARTVFIDDLGVGVTDFGISRARLDALIESGYAETESWIRRRRP